MINRFILWTAIVCLWGTLAVQGQQTTATILGTVKDQTDAVSPGATVTATSTEPGISRTAVAGSRGEYRIPALGLGNYEISATMTGFQAAKRTGVTLTLGQEAVIDFTLSVGNVTEAGYCNGGSAAHRDHHSDGQRPGESAANAGHSVERAELY